MSAAKVEPGRALGWGRPWAGGASEWMGRNGRGQLQKSSLTPEKAGKFWIIANARATSGQVFLSVDRLSSSKVFLCLKPCRVELAWAVGLGEQRWTVSGEIILTWAAGPTSSRPRGGSVRS